MKENDDDLVLLAQFDSDIEANIIKGVLETNGVMCAINNEIFNSVFPIQAPYTAVKLMVLRRDLQMARDILASKSEDATDI